MTEVESIIAAIFGAATFICVTGIVSYVIATSQAKITK